MNTPIPQKTARKPKTKTGVEHKKQVPPMVRESVIDDDDDQGVKFAQDNELPQEIADLSIADRPLVWRDLPAFATRHGRTISDIVYDLALLTSHAVSMKTHRPTVVPFDLEMLIRISEIYPSSCSWVRPNVRHAFEMMYGDFIKTFDDEDKDAVRLALGRRYARLLGRVDTAQYRWLEEDGQITRRLGNILAKIEAVKEHGEDPREFFERVAIKIWSLRGLDVEKAFKMPTKESVKRQPGSKGRTMTPKKRSTQLPTYEGGAFA